VEQTVDTKIHSVKLAAKDAAYNIMKEIGWGVLTQIGEIVAHVQDSIHKKNSTATQSSNKATSSPSADQHDRDEHDDDDDQDQILQKSPSKDSTQLSSFSSSSLNSLKDHSHRKEEDEQQEQQTISNASEHQQHQHDKNFNSFSSNSLASMDSTSNLKQQNYIDDFKNMLKQGLFVFAWYNPSFVNNGNGEQYDSTETKHFKLRIFTFQDSERTNDDDDDDEIDDDEIPSFVLNPVDASKHEHQNRKQSDAILIPITHISHIKGSGGNGIQFLALDDDEYDEDSDVQSSAIAEIELAEGDDRDTLLDGLRSLFFDLKRSIEQKEDSSFENNAMNEEEEEESEEDILNESDEVDEGIEVDELLEKEEEEIDVHEELKDLSDHGLSEEVTPLDGIMEAKNHQNSFVDIDVIDDNEANHCEKYRD